MVKNRKVPHLWDYTWYVVLRKEKLDRFFYRYTACMHGFSPNLMNIYIACMSGEGRGVNIVYFTPKIDRIALASGSEGPK